MYVILQTMTDVFDLWSEKADSIKKYYRNSCHLQTKTYNEL